jgi:protein TonB
MNPRLRLAAAISLSFHLLLALAAFMIPLAPPLPPPLPATIEIVAASDFVPPQLLSQGDATMQFADDDPGQAAAGPESAADAAEPDPVPEPITETSQPAEAAALPSLLAGNADLPSLAPLVKVSGVETPVEPVAGYQAGTPITGSGDGGDSGGGGGTGTGGSGSARVLRGASPKYPAAARKAGWEGAVVVSILVDETGRAAAVTIRESSRYDSLDEAAVEAVKKWRFSPARRNGEPVASMHTVRVRFRLTDPH